MLSSGWVKFLIFDNISPPPTKTSPTPMYGANLNCPAWQLSAALRYRVCCCSHTAPEPNPTIAKTYSTRVSLKGYMHDIFHCCICFHLKNPLCDRFPPCPVKNYNCFCLILDPFAIFLCHFNQIPLRASVLFSFEIYTPHCLILSCTIESASSETLCRLSQWRVHTFLHKVS